MLCSWADNAEIVAWARANNLSVTSAVESVGGEGSVFGWCPDDRCFLFFGLMCVADSLTVKAPSFVRGGQDGRHRAQRAGEATQHVVSARVEARISSTEACHLASHPQPVDRRSACSGVQYDQKRHEPGGDIGRVV